MDVPLTAGATTTVAVVGTDAASNVKTDHYDVPVDSGSSRALTYDLNGNMLGNGAGQSHTWDSADRMTKITYTGGATTEFTYDGQGRRLKIVEKNSGGSITSEKRFVWEGMAIAEERDGSNNLTKRFYSQGVMVGSNEFYYTRDHLGSIRELTDDTGAIEARYDYDPYGRVTKVSGSGDADFRYTGHYFHATSGLHLAPYRAYDADSGRWLGRDPLGEAGGINVYVYVASSPVNQIDSLGLKVEFRGTKSQFASTVRQVGFLKANSPAFSRAWQAAIASPITWTFNAVDRHQTQSHSNLYWQPGRNVLMDNGKVYYAIMDFAHEVGHAYDFSAGLTLFGKGYSGDYSKLADNETEAFAVDFANRVSKEVMERTGVDIGHLGNYWDLTKGTPFPGPNYPGEPNCP